MGLHSVKLFAPVRHATAVFGTDVLGKACA